MESLRQPSQNFKNLVESMLCENPNDRITINEIKKHPWFQSDVANTDEIKTELYDSIKNIEKELTEQARVVPFKEIPSNK